MLRSRRKACSTARRLPSSQRPKPLRFIHHDSLGSTQDEARALYAAGKRGPLWVSADRQTQGRGRMQRRWVSASGNLSATLLYPSTAAPAQTALHGFAASLAIAETLDSYNPAQPVTLKWPNDVLISGAKVSGLLIERESEALLLGIGINLLSHPDDTPYPATHLLREMQAEDLALDEPLFTGSAAVLALLSAKVVGRFRQLAEDGFAPIRQEWEARAHHIGQTVTAAGKTGKFRGLALDGALCLILPDGTETRVHAGDVSFG